MPGTYKAYVTDAIGCQDSIQVLVMAVPLAINFTSMHVYYDYNGTPTVTWTSDDDQHCRFYDVERSNDGKTFAAAGRVLANGKGMYQFADAAAPLGKDLFYRIKATEFDGTVSYSRIIRLKSATTETEWTVYPTLFKQALYLQLSGATEQRITVSIYNNEGRLAYQKNINLEKGTQLITLDEVATLPAGLYLVRIGAAETLQMQSFKVVKTN